jgi:hypothetical protein
LPPSVGIAFALVGNILDVVVVVDSGLATFGVVVVVVVATAATAAAVVVGIDVDCVVDECAAVEIISLLELTRIDLGVLRVPVMLFLFDVCSPIKQNAPSNTVFNIEQ